MTIKVENASLDELLKAVFADTGLAFKREGASSSSVRRASRAVDAAVAQPKVQAAQPDA